MMNRLFTPGERLAEPMREVEIALRDPERPAIVLATWDDPGATRSEPLRLRQEILWEMAARVFGKRFPFEYDFALPQDHSLPRFCRTITRKPACVFAYNLEALRSESTVLYEEAIVLLNQQREDFRQTDTSLVLLVRADMIADIYRLAPDFADWRSASVSFVVPQGESVPAVAMPGLPLWQADDLRRQAQRWEKSLAQAKDNPALQLDFQRRLVVVWQQLGERERAQAARVAAATTAARADDTGELRRLYLDYVISACGSLTSHGASQTVRDATVPLDTIYSSLPAKHEFTKYISDDFFTRSIYVEIEPPFPMNGYQAPHKLVREPIDLPRALRKNTCLVVFGVPGAGKTTLTRFLAYQFAKACQEEKETVFDRKGESYGKPLLPIWVRVADFAEAIRRDQNLTVAQFLTTAFSDLGIAPEDLGKLFQVNVNEGIFVLFDGLDEVVSVALRREVAQRIQQFASGLATGSRVLVTSRIAGYNEVRLSREFTTCRLCQMTRDQIAPFLTNWYAAVETFQTPDTSLAQRQTRVDIERKSLLSAVDTAEEVHRLVETPLHLMLLALIHRNGEYLPERRVELYRLVSKILLREWRLERVKIQASSVMQAEVDDLLASLAYWMHENEPTGLIAEEKVVALLCQWLGEARGLSPDAPEMLAAVQDFLRRVRENSGIFVERAPGKYAFMHRIFEEYFAAQYIVSDFLGAAERINKYRRDARWQEVIRLAIASEKPKNAAHLIRSAIWHPDGAKADTGYRPSAYEHILHRDLMLAIECIGDCKMVEPSLLQSLGVAIANLIAVSFRNAVQRDAYTSRLLRWPKSGVSTTIATMLTGLLPDKRIYSLVHTTDAILALGVINDVIFRYYVDLLSHESLHVVTFAMHGLLYSGIAKETIIPLLIDLLSHENFYIVEIAISGLAQLGLTDDAIVSALVELLTHEHTGIVRVAAKKLFEQKKETARALSALLGLLTHRDEVVVQMTVWDLMELGVKTEIVTEFFVRQLKDDPAFVYNRAWVIIREIEVDRERVTNALRDLLTHEAPLTVHYAIKLLETYGVKRDSLIDSFMGLLKHKHGDVVEAAAEALRDLKVTNDTYINALVELLKHPEPKHVLVGVGKLAGLKVTDPGVVDSMLGLLTHEDPAVAHQTVFYLVHLGAEKEKVAETFLTLLADKRRTQDVMRHLGELGVASPSAVKALVGFLTHEDAFVVQDATDALLKLGVETERVTDTLISLLKQENPYVAEYAVKRLISLQVPSEAVLNALISFLGEPINITADAIKAIARYLVSQEAITDNAITNLVGQLTHREPRIVEATVKALGQLGVRNDAVLDALTGLLSHRDTFVINTVMEIITAWDSVSETIIHAYIKLLTHPNIYLAENAAVALIRWGIITTPVIMALATAISSTKVPRADIGDLWSLFLQMVQRSEAQGIPLPPDAYEMVPTP